MPNTEAKAFVLTRPDRQSGPVIFASPHSGRDYSASFLAQILPDRLLIRSSEDAFVDQLFDMAPDLGAPLLVAKVPQNLHFKAEVLAAATAWWPSAVR